MKDKPIIAGLQKLTLLDYPDKMAAILFLPGCNMACPFCHNSELIHGQQSEIDYDDVMAFLKKRKNMLDGVVITGGEPTLQDITPLLQDIKNLGYSIKVDTNGSHPEAIHKWLSANIVDYIAMDIKNSPLYYARTCGTSKIKPETIDKSIVYLKHSNIPHEFRTTVTPSLHDVEDIETIAKWIGKEENFFIQPFVKRDTVPDQSLIEPSDQFLLDCLRAAKPHVFHAEIRGRDLPSDTLTN